MSNKLKRILSVLMVVAVAVGLSACGGETSDPSKVKGETHDTGKFSVLVPDGWMVNEVSFGGEVDEYSVQIFKGAKDEMDMFSTPYMYIRSGMTKDTTGPAIDIAEAYSSDTAEQLNALTTGEYTWDAAKADTGSSSYGEMFIVTADEPYKFQVDIASEKDGKKISLEDADVQAILASLKETAD